MKVFAFFFCSCDSRFIDSVRITFYCLISLRMPRASLEGEGEVSLRSYGTVACFSLSLSFYFSRSFSFSFSFSRASLSFRYYFSRSAFFCGFTISTGRVCMATDTVTLSGGSTGATTGGKMLILGGSSGNLNSMMRKSACSLRLNG